MASGAEVSVNDLFMRISGTLAYRQAPERVDPRPGDVRRSMADITSSAELLGFKPSYDLESGIAETLRWYSDHYMAGRH